MTTRANALACVPMKTIPSATLDKVTLALAPTEAILSAEYTRQLQARCDRLLADLAADGWDAEKRYAFPHGGMSRKAYAEQRERYNLCQAYTQGTKPFRSSRDPDIREPKPDNAERIAERAAKMAREALEGYCAKLAGKIDAQAKVDACDAVSVTYQGNCNPWGWSFVNVETTGKAQRWETKMIVNVSCLGKVFNQWPTRLT